MTNIPKVVQVVDGDLVTNDLRVIHQKPVRTNHIEQCNIIQKTKK